MTRTEPGFGLIGSGVMGRSHALALHTVAAAFEEIDPPRRVAIADVDRDAAVKAAEELGFERGTGDWRELLDDPAIDVIDICTPNHLASGLCSPARHTRTTAASARLRAIASAPTS